jgi:alcohol dehydrogenase
MFRVLSFGARRKAKRLKVGFRFLFMRANGAQLSQITSLIDQGVIRPVMDRVFPFEETKDAVDYVEGGRAKGKVVVKVR